MKPEQARQKKKWLRPSKLAEKIIISNNVPLYQRDSIQPLKVAAIKLKGVHLPVFSGKDKTA